ncbi:Cytosolic phospholipase A2 zeta [Saguinus oedipus]|uniref:Cytosolic phospholipase A2 zeta n=1 Tax=Saguinus oedipus TaxID=9490 RepID=A0ABQ9V2I6_SAGOE|nr:Cytosolic phospholipase A2 zeta [Saguinus oedipus]
MERLQYYTQELGVRERSGHRGHPKVYVWVTGVMMAGLMENPDKLSDQQEAVHQGQNPYPIYAGVNVRTNISGEDFAGAWV